MFGIVDAVVIAAGTVLAMAVTAVTPEMGCGGCKVTNTTAICSDTADAAWVQSSTGSCPPTCNTYALRIKGRFCTDGSCDAPPTCNQLDDCSVELKVEYISDCDVDVVIASSGCSCSVNSGCTTHSLGSQGGWTHIAFPVAHTDCGDSCSITATITPTTGDCSPVAVTWRYDCTGC